MSTTTTTPRVVTCLAAAERDAKWLYVEGPEPQRVRSPGAVYSWQDGFWGMECSAWRGWKPCGWSDLDGYGGRFMALAVAE